MRYVLFRRESINCSYLLGRSNKRLFLSCCHSTEKSTQSGGGAGVILCVTIRLDANPVAGLGSLRKRRRPAAVGGGSVFFSLICWKTPMNLFSCFSSDGG